MRIIVVEDEVKIREGMVKLIEKHTDHTIVATAVNGMEGYDLILRYHPDLVITDIRMPEMDGLQMLENLKSKGKMQRAVLLTGYSEFAYARKAIGIGGIMDYLLKPIGPLEVVKLLNNINEKIIGEHEEKQGEVKNLIRELALNETVKEETTYQKLMSMAGFQEHFTYQLYLGYIGAQDSDYRQEFQEILDQIVDKNKSIVCYTSYLNHAQEVICLVGGTTGLKDFQIEFERKVLYSFRNAKHRLFWCMEELPTISKIHEKMKDLKELLSQGVALHSKKLIRVSDLKQVEFETFVYPIEIEKEIKDGICSGDKSRIKEGMDHFILYMKSHTFPASDIKNGFMKLILFMTGLYQEFDAYLYDKMKNMYSLKKIGMFHTFWEIEDHLAQLTEMITEDREEKEDIRNYTIKRVMNYIRKHYQEGITLEEVASKLSITPEYLSTLFNREMGMNFTTFLKQFRISHAKRLLKGTNMKIYEISQAVGYRDSKYFMRVFKEELGISAKEFREMK